MRCSRVALSLLLAVLGCAVIALTPADGRRGVAADIGPAPPAYIGLDEEPDDANGAYDWGENEYGYVYTRPESEFGEQRQEDDWTAPDQDEYASDDAPEHAYDFEDEYTNDDYRYTDGTTADRNEYVYNEDEYIYGQQSESANGEEVYDDGLDDQFFNSPSGGLDVQRDDDADRDIDNTDDEVVYDEYDDGMDEDIDDQMDDDEIDDEMDDETDGEVNDEIDNEVYDEMNGEMDDGQMDDGEMDDGEMDDENEGYSYEYAYPEEQYGYSEGAEECFEQIVESADEAKAMQPDYSYDGEFGYTGGDWAETASEAEGDWTADDRDATVTGIDDGPTECDYGQYECWDDESAEVSDEKPDAESTECEYDEPFDFYGECYNVEPLPAVAKRGLELFAWQPADLLLSTDREVLQSLERLCEEPSGVRRATLNEYIECLGMEAIDFTTRFEDATGTAVLGLADDLPGCAALLASFRLLEKGELNVEEAVDVLRKSLAGLSQEWIEGVSEITAHAFDDSPENQAQATSAGRPLFGTVISLAAESLDDLGGAICKLSRRLGELKGRF